MAQRILVLGASGYIGQHLVQALSEQGYPVLAAARHVDRLQKLNLPGVSCHPLDLNQPQGLSALLAQVDTVYYLLHGMGEGGDFIAHERRVAVNVRDALRATPVRQLIFSAPCRRRKLNNRIICAPGKSPPTFCGNPPSRSPNCGRELSSAPVPPLSK